MRYSPWYRGKEADRNSNTNKCAGLISYKPDAGTIQARRCTDGWGVICVRPKGMFTAHARDAGVGGRGGGGGARGKENGFFFNDLHSEDDKF